MSAWIPRTLVVLLLAVTMSACGAPEPPEEAGPGPTAGQCFGGSVTQTDGTVDPDLAKMVSCDKDHLYYVVAALPVPAEFLGGETADEQLAHRTGLVSKTTPAGEGLARWADTECRDELATLVGLTEVPGDIDYRAAAVVPAGALLPHASLTDEPLWVRGVQNVVCTVRWLDAADAATSRPLALPEGTTLAGFFSNAMPIESRQCLALANGQLSPTSCDVPHFSEPVVAFNAATVLGTDWGASVEPVTPTREQYAALDAMCAAFLPISVGAANPAIAIRAELTNTGAYCALVSAQSADYDVTGSLVGAADSAPTLVAIP